MKPHTLATVSIWKLAQAMRQSDPTIKVIGWGDSGWAPRMAGCWGTSAVVGVPPHVQSGRPKGPVLKGERYRKDPEATRQVLMDAWTLNDRKIRSVRDSLRGKEMPLAMRERYFSIPGNNRKVRCRRSGGVFAHTPRAGANGPRASWYGPGSISTYRVAKLGPEPSLIKHVSFPWSGFLCSIATTSKQSPPSETHNRKPEAIWLWNCGQA